MWRHVPVEALAERRRVLVIGDRAFFPRDMCKRLTSASVVWATRRRPVALVWSGKGVLCVFRG
jgi:hypothetical protein